MMNNLCSNNVKKSKYIARITSYCYVTKKPIGFWLADTQKNAQTKYAIGYLNFEFSDEFSFKWKL